MKTIYTTDHANQRVKKNGFANLTDYQNHLAKENGFSNRPDYQNHLAKENGFRNHTDYQNHLVKKKGFKNRTDYLNHWVKKKGFKNRTDYLLRTPEHRAKQNDRNHHRRAWMDEALDAATPEERALMVAQQVEKLRIKREFGLKATLEHVVARVNGGTHTITNTCLISARDNSAKHANDDVPVTPFTYQELVDNPGFLRYLLLLQRDNLPTFIHDQDGFWMRTPIPGFVEEVERTAS